MVLFSYERHLALTTLIPTCLNPFFLSVPVSWKELLQLFDEFTFKGCFRKEERRKKKETEGEEKGRGRELRSEAVREK